jgi:hypothetical protein
VREELGHKYSASILQSSRLWYCVAWFVGPSFWGEMLPPSPPWTHKIVNVPSCRPLEISQLFGETCFLCLYSYTQKTEAIYSSETMVYFYHYYKVSISLRQPWESQNLHVKSRVNCKRLKNEKMVNVYTRLHGVTSQKTVVFIFTAVRTWDLIGSMVFTQRRIGRPSAS